MVVEKRPGVDWRSNTRATVSACAIKIDDHGKKVWEKVFVGDCGGVAGALQVDDGGFLIAGGRGPDFVEEMHPTSDGGWVVAGTTGSFPGWENIYLVKVDDSGQLVWERSLGGDNHDYGISVLQETDGGFLVLGDTRPFGEGSSALLIRTNSQGEKIWEKTFGRNFWSTYAHPSGDGGYVIVGAEEGYAKVIKTDPDGKLIRAKDLSGLNPYYVKPTDAGSMIIVGGTAGPDRWGDVYAAKIRLEGSGQKETGPPAIKVYLNENLLPLDVPPVIESGRTLAPFRVSSSGQL